MLLFMNNDVFLTYDAISNMVGYALCSNIGCLGHRLVWDEDQNSIQHDGQVLYNSNGQWIGPGHHNYKIDVRNAPKTNVKVEGVTAAFLMMRKDIFEKVGGFDEQYKDIFQDVDLNLKVSKLGYDNFCIREKALIHVDHGTRKGDSTPDSPKDFEKYKRDWTSKGLYPVKNKKRYSILICATDKIQLQTLVESIKTREEYEIIFINNKSNYFWASEALNQLTRVSEGEIIFWMHQDVTFDAYEPFATINGIIKQIGENFGILGPAGMQVGGKGSVRGVDFSSLKYNFDYMRCQTVDEFCIIGKRSNGLKFGEYLDHFHFYGGDICLESLEKGLSNFVIKIPITHHSGGDGNLTSGDGYYHYLKQGRKFYRKWKSKYPKISTTTVHFRPSEIFWFLGWLLKLTPNKEVYQESKIDFSPNIKKYLQTNEKDVAKYLDEKKEGTSIIILSKDRLEYIKPCIEALQDNIKSKHEIIIGDTGTTNAGVLTYYDEIKKSGVKIVDAGDYQFSKNNNLVAQKYANFDKCLFLNNDVFVNDDVVEKMSKYMVGKKAIIGMKLLYENGTIQHAGVEMVQSKERNPNNFYLPEHMYYEEKNKEISNEIVDCVTGACLMIPTKMFIKYGGFDENYEHVFQDVDLCLKIKSLGYENFCVNEIWSIHIESGTRDAAINTPDYDLMTTRWGRNTYK
jgi:GT2 family glycosyltransferase